MSIEQFLPPDPDEMNNERADWADSAICDFVNNTGTDHEDVLADLLDALMHWCDRNGFDFDKELMRGRGMYDNETSDRGTAGAAYEAACRAVAEKAGYKGVDTEGLLISIGGRAGSGVEYYRSWAQCCRDNGIEVKP